MNDPEKQIEGVITSLCRGSYAQQQAALEDYFLPGASFTHPFCRVPRFEAGKISLPWFRNHSSRDLVRFVYRWYRLMSPEVRRLEIDSVGKFMFLASSLGFAFTHTDWLLAVHDFNTDKLYVHVHQTFALWFVPTYHANVQLVTVLSLAGFNRHSDGTLVALPPKDKDATTRGRRVSVGFQNAITFVDEVEAAGKSSHLVSPVRFSASLPARHADGENGARSASRSPPPVSSRGKDAAKVNSHESPHPGESILRRGSGEFPKKVWYIASQEDLYQMNDILALLFPWALPALWFYCQVFSSLVCAVLAITVAPTFPALHFLLAPIRRLFRGFMKRVSNATTRSRSEQGRGALSNGGSSLKRPSGNASPRRPKLLGDPFKKAVEFKEDNLFTRETTTSTSHVGGSTSSGELAGSSSSASTEDQVGY